MRSRSPKPFSRLDLEIGDTKMESVFREPSVMTGARRQYRLCAGLFSDGPLPRVCDRSDGVLDAYHYGWPKEEAYVHRIHRYFESHDRQHRVLCCACSQQRGRELIAKRWPENLRRRVVCDA